MPKSAIVPAGLRERMDRALRALHPAKYLKLLRFARWQAMALDTKAHGRDAHDLLHEAILATLHGRCLWREDVDLFEHLLNVLRSLTAKRLDPEKSSVAEELLQEIQALFADNIVDLVILDHLGQGYSPAESREILGLSPDEYLVAVKRIRQKLQNLRDPNPVGR